MFSRIALTLAGGLLAASPVAAQQASASEPIVVEGIANSQKQIDRFIKKLTPGPIHGQLSRFQTKVCPLSIGLTPERNALVVKRMRDVAAAARIPLAEPDCRPNIILIVTNNKAALIEQLLRKRSYMFPDAWSMATIHALERDPSPDAAWAIEGVTSAGGQPLNYGSEVPVNRTTRAASRLTTAVVPYFAAAVLVVQTNALDGLTTTQLADYAAMRTFVRTDPKLIDPSTPGTILTLLETPMGQPVPLTLTAWDLSFFKSFYATRPDVWSEYQRAQTRVLMTRELEKQQQAGRQ